LTNKPTNKLLYDAIKDRGTAYLMVFRELKARYGEDEAKEVMRRASRAHGLHIGKSLAGCAPRDFEGMARGFAKSPDDVEAGCSEEEIVTLLCCASALDEATLEAAGFDYEIELWSPGQEGCCLTRITEKTKP
jgi:hypothetical protein